MGGGTSVESEVLLCRHGLQVTAQRLAVLRRIQPAGSPADCAVGYTPCLMAAEDADYEIDEAEVVYWGRCPECVATAFAATSQQKEPSERSPS
ncbi:MAG: ferric uptake regulator, Fur family [Acidimicrobiales bacterium]|nr:ferric uptake regulator, Fur family [Acidimicrobiales bacterium]